MEKIPTLSSSTWTSAAFPTCNLRQTDNISNMCFEPAFFWRAQKLLAEKLRMWEMFCTFNKPKTH